MHAGIEQWTALAAKSCQNRRSTVAIDPRRRRTRPPENPLLRRSINGSPTSSNLPTRRRQRTPRQPSTSANIIIIFIHLSSCHLVSQPTTVGPASKTTRPLPNRRGSLRLRAAHSRPRRRCRTGTFSHRRRISSSPLTGGRSRLRHARSPTTASSPRRGPSWSRPTGGLSRRRRVRSRRSRRRSTMPMGGPGKVNGRRFLI